MKIGQSAGKSFAYILGVYLGDGCVTRNMNYNCGKVPKRFSTFRLNTIDEDFALAVKSAIEDISDSPVNICKHDVSKSSKPNHSLRCGDESLCNTLVIHTHGKAFIPPYVFDGDKDNKLAFIAGLMDSEGFVTYNKRTGSSYYMGFKCCESWVRDFARLLESVGIMVGKISDCPPYKDGYRTPTRFHIKLASWVRSGARFRIQRKQARVDEWQRLSSTTNMLDAV